MLRAGQLLSVRLLLKHKADPGAQAGISEREKARIGFCASQTAKARRQRSKDREKETTFAAGIQRCGREPVNNLSKVLNDE